MNPVLGMGIMAALACAFHMLSMASRKRSGRDTLLTLMIIVVFMVAVSVGAVEVVKALR